MNKRNNVFDGAYFIKPDTDFKKEFSYRNIAPMFRKVFYIENTEPAEMYVCGLGYGEYYLNGKKVTEDKFIAPYSDYNKTLWYNKYNVSHLLKKGKNVFCAQLGNGFFNESIETAWQQHKAKWRDNPKIIFKIIIGNKSVCSDNSVVYKKDSAIIFNQLRSGEYYDARLYEDWTLTDYDDSAWKPVLVDDNYPKGVFRFCKCEPIRAINVIKAQKILTNKNGYVFDFGQNISGYIKISFIGDRDKVYTFKYAEEVDENNLLKLNGLNVVFPNTEFQTDKFVSDGKYSVWSPSFVYHGFRYVEVIGFDREPKNDEIKAVIVHQAMKSISRFDCSDELVDKIYTAGKASVLSNMFYVLTDCPTREKYGWTNDAQASCEQILYNFDAEKFFDKWLYDFSDAMKYDGDMPGVIPTAGYGYHHGPVCDGALFEIPYRLYTVNGNSAYLKRLFPQFKKYLHFMKNIIYSDKNDFILGDWNGVGSITSCSIEFISFTYYLRFLCITSLAAELLNEKEYSEYLAKEKEICIGKIKAGYIKSDGSCVYNTQTAVSILLCAGFDNKDGILKKQLISLIDSDVPVFTCGMLGFQYLFKALDICGRQDLAYRIIVNKSDISFYNWFRQGATTLWETWKNGYTDSKNHHMYSCVLAWFIRSIAGINTEDGFKNVNLEPSFISGINYCNCSLKTKRGEITVNWTRRNGKVLLKITSDAQMNVVFQGKKCVSGLVEISDEKLSATSGGIEKIYL